MTARYIRIVSPTEPSGVAWLLNCLLELNVCIYRSSRSSTWKSSSRGEKLSDRDQALQQWLPSLEPSRTYKFRPELEVEWTHDWPTTNDRKADITLLFVRDSRDALYSLWKRDGASLSLTEFTCSIDPVSGLDRVRKHVLHLSLWLARNPYTVRFEDYKRDDFSTLQSICGHLAIDVTATDIRRAALASSFERAQQAEQDYRSRHGANLPVMNRAGAVGGWRQDPSLSGAVESWCPWFSLVGHDLGYAYPGQVDESISSLLGLASRSPLFRKTVDRAALRSSPPTAVPHPANAFLAQLDEDQIRRSGLSDGDLARILSTALLVATGSARWQAVKLATRNPRRLRKFLTTGSRKLLP
jgi:hypothetical protein